MAEKVEKAEKAEKAEGAEGAEGGGTITVEVVYAKPEVQRLIALDVPRGTTLIEAVRRSGILEHFPEIDPDSATMGIFGEVVDDPRRELRPFDRVEIYRPLQVDPKEQRRARAEAQRRRR